MMEARPPWKGFEIWILFACRFARGLLCACSSSPLFFNNSSLESSLSVFVRRESITRVICLFTLYSSARSAKSPWQEILGTEMQNQPARLQVGTNRTWAP
ncbi:hypothetical protein IWX90DRAFT_152540 [Phyllosticta citrichinensis]|uniref:Secreted protein n=1 Tax=Phyllosticta citrichinensis TaxID=1130410 RepID=A0ABR1Y010_9PEZI